MSWTTGISSGIVRTVDLRKGRIATAAGLLTTADAAAPADVIGFRAQGSGNASQEDDDRRSDDDGDNAVLHSHFL